MAILPGRRLGPYEILSAIGAGGMGEVYRARDTRLDRIVAIKVLSDRFAEGPASRERFEREARTIASLNHPHICTLYDTGHQDDIDFLVMEYLEGETLAQRLVKGALPIQQVLQFAIEISDALDKAHRKGITHRDLKPGNIMLTKTGTKLLDFGLAKLKQEVAPANVPLSDLPTAMDPLTAQGTILGTLQYMAPEQVEGKDVDARTDIFAFGTIEYEMATGKRAFEGETSASVIGAILKDDPPPISSLQPMSPPSLDRVVRICLAKEPDERWQNANDLCRELKWIAANGSQISSTTAVQRSGVGELSRRTLIFSLGALLVGVVVSGAAVWILKPSPRQPVTRTIINLPPGQQLAGLDSGPAVVLSPDGTQMVYVARQGGTQQLYLRAMDSLESKSIPGTDGASNPFFSPDGQWLGFFSAARLMKVSVNGGAAQTLSAAVEPRGASWGSQGMIAYGITINTALLQVPDTGGTPKPLTSLQDGEVSHRWPEFLPGGKGVLFAAGANGLNFTSAQVAVQSSEKGERRNLIQGGTHPRYALSGHLVYAQGGGLMAAPFDAQRLVVSGPAVPILDGILESPVNGAAQFSFSSTGSLVYVAGGVQSAQRRLVWVSRNGTEQPIAATARAYLNPRLSPDGRTVAVTIEEQQEDQIWLYDLARETMTRLTFGGNLNNPAVWTPDNKRIAFASNKEGTQSIFWQPADGSAGPERLSSGEHTQIPMSWSPDGHLLAFFEVNPATGYDLWVLRMGIPSASGQARKTELFLRTPFNESVPRFSPDGRWLAYISDESGRYEIYLQPYPGAGGKRQISTEGGTEPVWNPNSRELFYRSGGKMMAVDIVTQPGFSAGKPRKLFEGPYQLAPLTAPNYDVSPDGQHFLMLKPSEQEQAAPTQINVVLNWFEELKQKVPLGKK